MKKLKKKKKSQLYKKTRPRLKEPINLTAKRPTIWFQSLNSEPTKINKRKIAISIYFFSCSQYLWKVKEKELTGKWLCRRCSLEMLGSGAGEGVAEVDRSLGGRKTATVAKWWLVWDLFHAMMVVWRESGSGRNNNGIFLKFWNLERGREQRSGLRSEEVGERKGVRLLTLV